MARTAPKEDSLKCPYCGSYCADDTLYCPSCKQPLPTLTNADRQRRFKPEPVREPRTPLQRLAIALAAIATLAAVSVGGYKLSTWVTDYRLTRLYTRGPYTPTVSTVTMTDLRSGHSVVFYGKDGDQIYLPEMDRSLTISGGVARMDIADSDWFGPSVNDIEYADVTLSPLLISEVGTKTRLPLLNFQVEVPESPLVVSSPATERKEVVTSVYPLVLNVVPGSTVFVNGENVTAAIDRSGLLSTNISVEPIGDNLVTLIVRTPSHRETRKELHIIRPAFDINLELDTTVSDKSPSRTMAITGKAEPGATISVDTDKPGKQDAVISFPVNYLPSLAEYSAKAWAMDYSQLKLMFEQWNGRVFQCRGELVDAFTDDEKSYLVMDVGDETEQQLIILENRSATASPTLGRRYVAYADVSGQHMYRSQYYPKLIARYLDLP